MTEHLLRMRKAQRLIHSATLKEKEKEGRKEETKRGRKGGEEEKRGDIDE